LIPALTTLIQDESHPQTAIWAMDLLSRLGPQGLEVVKAVLANANRPFRETTAFCMAAGSTPVVGTNICLPPLRAASFDKTNWATFWHSLRMWSRITAKNN